MGLGYGPAVEDSIEKVGFACPEINFIQGKNCKQIILFQFNNITKAALGLITHKRQVISLIAVELNHEFA